MKTLIALAAFTLVAFSGCVSFREANMAILASVSATRTKMKPAVSTRLGEACRENDYIGVLRSDWLRCRLVADFAVIGTEATVDALPAAAKMEDLGASADALSEVASRLVMAAERAWSSSIDQSVRDAIDEHPHDSKEAFDLMLSVLDLTGVKTGLPAAADAFFTKAVASGGSEKHLAFEVAALADLAVDPYGSLNTYRTLIQSAIERTRLARIQLHLERLGTKPTEQKTTGGTP